MDYQEQLAEAVSVLSASRIPTSVYNLPRCVLDRNARFVVTMIEVRS